MLKPQLTTICRALGVTLASWGLAACSEVDTPAIGQNQTQITDESSVSLTDAGRVAQAFGTERFGSSLSRSNTSSIYPVSDRNGKTIAYAVNYDGGGWVLVGSDSRYYPVLAYSHEQSGSFSITDLNPGVKMWIEDVSLAIESSEELDSATTAHIALEWQKYLPETMSASGSGLPGGNSPEAVACRTRLKYLNDTYYQDGWSFTTLASANNSIVPSYLYAQADAYNSPYELTIFGSRNFTSKREIGPLTTTKWDQENGYNALCPNGIRAGCVPVAMAQIMKFHEYPTRFDWANMADMYATTASQYLISEIRRTIGMGDTVTGSNEIEALSAFKAFGYTAVLKNHPDDIIREIFTNKRPVYMQGVDHEIMKGHAWVCDGIKESTTEFQHYIEYLTSNNTYDNYGESSLTFTAGDYTTDYKIEYSMNWGWGGFANGWFVDVKVAGYDWQYERKNIYLYK